jgi:hypothetical protein
MVLYLLCACFYKGHTPNKALGSNPSIGDIDVQTNAMRAIDPGSIAK